MGMLANKKEETLIPLADSERMLEWEEVNQK